MYSLGIFIYIFLVRLASLFNRKARLLVKGHGETFSRLASACKDSSYIWFHVSSLGEFEQGRVLMEMIKKQNPEQKILLTFFSPSGYTVRKDWNGADIICYMPFDTPRNARRFLDAVNISAAFYVKYDFWPNFIKNLSKRGIRQYCISAIFNPNQLFFKSYGGFYRKMLCRLDHIFVQDQNSKELLAGIGYDKTTIVGDTRCDRVLSIAGQSKELPLIGKFAGDSPLFMAGSSWPADEKVYLPFFETHTDWKLVVAPHELGSSRIKSLLDSLKSRKTVLLSDADEQNIAAADTLVIDCYGILSSIYKYCTVAYIGGGFGVGIHNTLEAAVFGKPVLFGPNNKRFREAQELKSIGAGFQIGSTNELVTIMDKFISDPAYQQKAGQAAAGYVSSNAGSSQKILSSVSL